MRLVMTLLVRDEADIIRAHLDYHLSIGVDHVIVTDNLSADETREIVQEYVACGVATLLDEPQDDYAQAKWVTRMARMAATEQGADWVINSDADEFWWPTDLKDRLRALPRSVGCVRIPRSNFLPVRMGRGQFWERMVLRQRMSLNGLGEPLQAKVLHRAHPAIQVRQGNHAASAPGLGETATLPDAMIMHFPMRSYAQFRNKIRNGGAAYERNRTLPRTIGHVWRQLWQAEQQGKLARWYEMQPHADDPGTLAQLAMGDLIEDTRLRDQLFELRAQAPFALPSVPAFTDMRMAAGF